MKQITLDKCIPNHPQRIKVYKRFYDMLKENIDNSFSLSDDDILKMSLNLERGIFNNTLILYNNKVVSQTWNELFKNIYINRAIIIYDNINPKGKIGNTTLLTRLLNKECDEFDICNFSPDKLFPERYNNLLKQYYDRVIDNEAITPSNVDQPDGVFKCGKCKSYKTTYYQIQTRSAKIIGWKSTLLITSWLCYWKNSCSPSYLILKC
jgi:transcription elongation factor S-II